MKEASKRDETRLEIMGVRDTLQQQKDFEIHSKATTKIYSVVIQSERLGFGSGTINFSIVIDLFRKCLGVVYDL